MAGREDPTGPAQTDWRQLDLGEMRPKVMISLRLDAEVLEHFKAQGRGYQTRINAVLRAYMTATSRR